MTLTNAGASGIQSGANFLGGIVNQIFAKKRIKQQNQANLNLSEYAYNRDLEMWNKQNAYNTPQMQMQRFEEAGLNPNLIYSKGTAGNAQQLPKYSAPRAERHNETLDVPQMLNMYQNIKMQSNQIDKIKADVELTHQKAENEGIINDILGTKADQAGFTLEKDKELHPYNVDYKKNAIDLQEQKAKEMVEDLIFKKTQNERREDGSDKAPWYMLMLEETIEENNKDRMDYIRGLQNPEKAKKKEPAIPLPDWLQELLGHK